MKTKSLIVSMAVVVLMAVSVACHHSKKESAEQLPAIDVAQATTDSVTIHKEYPGYLTANQEVEMVARVSGYLTSKPSDPGAYVKAGTVLYTIESSQYADQVRQSQASLADAESTYKYASTHYAAMQKALQSDAVSQMEVLEAKNAMETAQASIENARAALRTASTMLGYCTVRAPFSGHISDTQFSVGDYLAGSASPVTLATIYDDASMNVTFTIDDSEFDQINAANSNPDLRADMKKIPLVFEQQLPHKYTADLSYIAPAIDKSTGSMVVKAKIENPYNELRSGMYCKIRMPQAVMSKATLIKEASIATDQLGKYIYVVNDSNRVVYTPIEVGELVNDTLRVVTKGVKPGDRYVTKALLKVRDGMEVDPKLVK